MCQILFSESANPPKEAIVDSNIQNRDGVGFAYRDGGKVHFSKGFEAKQIDNAFIDMYFALPFPKAIHFRLATHGGTKPELTHPFPIKRGNPHDLKGTSGSVLFHNGIWRAYDDRLREAIFAGSLNPNVLNGGMSDSRAMAVLAQRFGEDILSILDIGSNKILVLRDDTYYSYGSWTQKEGWSASNSSIFRSRQSVSVSGLGEQKGKGEKGVKLDTRGLPLRGFEITGGVQAGHLNRHGNVRSRYRRGSVYTGERDLGPTAGEVEASGKLAAKLKEQDDALDAVRQSFQREHDKRDLPSGGYLSSTAEQLALKIALWQNSVGV